MGTCRGSLYECPYVQIYRDKLIRPNYDYPSKSAEGRKVRRAPSSKAEGNDVESDKSKTSNKSRVSEEDKAGGSSGVTLVRSTRAQDLRSQCNRDMLKPKSVCEKTRVVSPYIPTQQTQKKKRSFVAPATNRSVPTPKLGSDEKRVAVREKSLTAQSCRKTKREKLRDVTLHRKKTQEVIQPKVETKKEVDDSGDRPGLKKSQTFFICKGPKRGEGDDIGNVKTSPHSSSSDNSDSEYDEPPSPEPNPLTHNDSFCLIAKSSQNWSRKERRDDENRYREPTMILLPRPKKDDKGILKTSNRDLKSVDSLEKIDSEKIVRFSDEEEGNVMRKRKVLRKYVRRKNKLQNTIAAAWYRKNKIFQKYLQVLRAKSVLHANPDDVPENLKPFQVPVFVRERHEAEMLGLVPRKSKSRKGKAKKH